MPAIFMKAHILEDEPIKKKKKIDLRDPNSLPLICFAETLR